MGCKLGLYSPIWGLCVYAVAFITASVLIALSSHCRTTAQGDNSRYSQIDGLRGYLALGVFITHAATMRQFGEVGIWAWPPSSFFTMAGTVPVSLFFMITAFLFWGKAIRSRGRINPRWLLVSRLRRLAPLYLCTIPVLLLLVGIASDWTLHTSLSSLFISIGRWSLIGAGGHPDVNGVSDLYPQVWTLMYEWGFYAALPIIALLWRPPGSLIIITTIVAIQNRLVHPVALNFAVGIAVAQLVAFQPKLTWLNTRWAASAAVFAIALPGIFGSGDYSWKVTLCTTPFFVCVCYGNSIFGLLSNGPARLLGAASYSTYLLHVFALYFMVLGVSLFAQVGSLTAYSYWPIVFLLTVLLIVVSVMTFRFIEQPWMNKLPAEGGARVRRDPSGGCVVLPATN
jgi:peptidoglycan/LPS O-acetylase OafA/YrhL